MKRFKTNVRRDHKIFARTASRTKAVNLGRHSHRGGIRL